MASPKPTLCPAYRPWFAKVGLMFFEFPRGDWLTGKPDRGVVGISLSI